MMKRVVLVIAAALVLLLCSATACRTVDHVHDYGKWEIIVEPTMQTQGNAVRYCSAADGGKQEHVLPALSDGGVWTEDFSCAAAPTHTESGKRVFVSEYGRVELITAKLSDHIFGDWTIVRPSGLTDCGLAERYCIAGDGGKETVVLPDLSDGSVWTEDVKSFVASTHISEGRRAFISEYGRIEITSDRLPEHTFGDWQIIKQPAMQTSGLATRYCTAGDGGKEECTISPLSDAAVWEEDLRQYISPTHSSTGKRVFLSCYGRVEVTLDRLTEHTFGDWQIIEQPATYASGLAERYCTAGDGGKEICVVAQLSDSAVWTEKSEEYIPPSHFREGRKVFASVYGSVETVLEKLSEHVFGGWQITVAPTFLYSGEAQRVCIAADGGVQTVTIPNLTENSVWTEEYDKNVSPTHITAGKRFFSSVYGNVEVVVDKLGEHVFGEWELIAVPTLSEGGSAERYCIYGDGGIQTAQVPALSDSSVWRELSEHYVAPTHTGEGRRVFTSVYGRAEIALDRLTEHTYGEWNFIKKPTLTAGGVAERYCIYGDGARQVRDVAPLSDGSVWTLDEYHSIAPTTQSAGLSVYLSEYGRVEAVIPKISTPYAGRAYRYALLDSVSGVSADMCAIKSIYPDCAVTFDDNGKGTGNAYPFEGEISVRDYDAQTSLLHIVINGAGYIAYIDAESGIIIMSASRDAFTANVYLLTPDSGLNKSDISASYWWSGACAAVSFTFKDSTYTAYIAENGVHFGAAFCDGDGNAVAPQSAYNSPMLIIKTAEGKLVASLGFKNGDMQVLDGYQGVYGAVGQIRLDGLGGITLEDGRAGTYTLSGSDNYTFDVYTSDGKSYYRLTLDKIDKASYKLVMPMCVISFDSAVHIDSVSANLNVPFTLPTVADSDSYRVVGFYADPEYSKELRGAFTPVREAERIFVLCVRLYSVTVVYGNGLGEKVFKVAEGEGFSPEEPTYSGGYKFSCWYTTVDGTRFDWETGGKIFSDVTIYAEWENVPPYTVVSTSVYKFKRQNGVWTSSNREVNDSECVLVITVNYDGVLSFDWSVSSEEEFDVLTFSTNKSAVLPPVQSGESSGSVKTRVEAGEVITITYRKDSSTTGGLDEAKISNLSLVAE